jgi:hypothetical protein
MVIEFLGDAKLLTPGTGCRSWAVAPVSQDSFTRRMRIVMPDTARWDGSHPCALARGSDRCAPTLPSSAHEEGWPSVLVELTAPDVDEKNCDTNPITSAGILAKLAWSDAERYGLLRRHQLHRVAERSQPTRQMVGAARCRHADPARRQVRQLQHQLRPRQPAPGRARP